MHGSIAPSFVKEAARTVQVIKVIFVLLTTPEIHVCHLKITPKMARGVTVGFLVVLWSPLIVDEPVACIIWVQIFRMAGHELLRFWP